MIMQAPELIDDHGQKERPEVYSENVNRSLLIRASPAWLEDGIPSLLLGSGSP
jgi:hypothetical protein